MRRRLTSTLIPTVGLSLACMALLLADPIPSASCPLSVRSCGGESLEIDTGGVFKPAKLPKKKPAPIHLSVEGSIGMADGSPPPALRELILEIDRNATLDVRGLPACKLERIEGTETWKALKICGSALVGKGRTNVEVAFPEQSPLLPYSELLAFNGGVKGGVTTILIHAFLKSPVAEPVVIAAKISKIHAGRYETKLVAAVPPIAKGYGYVRRFQLEFFRLFAYKGKKRSFVKARCFDGKLQARATEIFSGGGPTMVTILKGPCSVKS